ncbi:MAG: hypothetical protein ABIT05_00545 [Chitinophagaceae bacterium]
MIRKILDWSEVWALLIPLAVILWRRNKATYLRPIRIYLWVALVLNTGIDLLAEYKLKWGIQTGDLLWNNNFLYNTGSIIRFFLFAWFFNLLRQRFMHRIKMALPFAFLVFVLANFIFYENFIPRGEYESFSSRLLATEAALLLFYCLQYFIFLIIEDTHTRLSLHPGFWVVTGLSIYVSVSFFIFLFYSYLSIATLNFAVTIWDVHNIVYIILCLFIAKQFYQKNE